MQTNLILSRQWVQFGAIAGILANLLFPILLVVDLPSYLEILLAGMFGILFSLTGFAMHHLMKHEQPTILTQIGALFIFVSGFLFNSMLTIQLTFKGYLYHYMEQVTEQQEINLLQWIGKTVDPIHLGLQVSNDFFLGLAMILFSIVMWRHSFFGKPWAVAGAGIAVSLLSAKLYAFPMTPYELGFPFILGPLIAVWFIAVCIQCLRFRQSIG